MPATTTHQPRLGRPPLDDKIVQSIRRARQMGLSLSDISFIMGVSQPSTAKYTRDIFSLSWRKARIIKVGKDNKPVTHLIAA